MFLVQSKAPRQIANVRPQHDAREEVRSTGHELPLKIPAVDAAVAGVARASDDIVVLGLLDGDEVGDEFRLRVCQRDWEGG